MTKSYPVIVARDIHKTYKDGPAVVHVLKGINLEVNRGEIVAIVGPSGSGKTTLLNIISCLDKADYGDLILDGMKVNDLDDEAISLVRRTKIGVVFQAFYLLPYLNAVENVEVPLIFAGLDDDAMRREKALKLLERAGMRDYALHKPDELSGGQQQKVAIARALVNNASILIADELTGNLDVASGDEVMTLVRELAERDGVTVLLATHDQSIARRADRVLLLKDGKVHTEIPTEYYNPEGDEAK